MTLYVQSEGTAARRKFTFVCVDDTDGKTPETGLSFSASEVALRKGGATSYTAVTNIGTIVEIGDGEYQGEFTAAELDTLGPLVVRIKKTGVRTTVIAVGQVIAVNLNDPVNAGLSALPGVAVGSGAGALPVLSASSLGPDITVGANGEVAANVVFMSSDTLNANALAADAVAEIQSGLATAAALAALPASFVTELLATVMEASATFPNAQTFHQQWNIMFANRVLKAPDNLEGSPYGFRNLNDTKDRSRYTMSAGVRVPTDLDGT